MQSAVLTLAMVVAPLAFMVQAYADAPAQCTMICCRKQVTEMLCQHGAGMAAMCGIQHQMSYGLAVRMVFTRLGTEIRLPRPPTQRAKRARKNLRMTNGFYRPPFEPPRA